MRNGSRSCRAAVDATAVLVAGWDETALYCTIAVTALFSFMDRLVEGLGIDFDSTYVKPTADRLADHGYLALPKMHSDPT